MNPAFYSIEVRRGGYFILPLTFYDVNGDLIDLNGHAPFTAQIRDTPKGPVILSFDIEDTDLDNGEILLTAETSATLSLPIRQARWDLLDALGTLWIEGYANLKPKISQ